MPYQTGSAASAAALIDAFCTFAETHAGFSRQAAVTVRRDTANPTPTQSVQKLSKGGWMWVFCLPEAGDAIKSVVITHKADATVDASTSWQSILSGSSLSHITTSSRTSGTVFNAVAPFTTYHFFTNGTEVHAAVEMTAGYYTHFGIGSLTTKYGTWTGGEFAYSGYVPHLPTGSPFAWNSTADAAYTPLVSAGENPCAPWDRQPRTLSVSETVHAVIRCQLYGNTFYCQSGAISGKGELRNLGSATGTLQYMSSKAIMVDSSPNAFNLRAGLVPVDLAVWDSSISLWRPIGRVELCRHVNIKHLNPGQLTSNDWRVFPLGGVKSNDNLSTPSIPWRSRDYGIAFKVTP